MDFFNLKSNIYNKKHIKSKYNMFHIKKKQNKSIECFVHQHFIKKYKSMPFNYNIYITNNIIFNDRSHLVSKFKEYLVLDDRGEFLKRYYKKNESLERLPRFFEFYFLYSKLFPNYTSVCENKFLYNNIHQKQRMIDLQEKLEKEKKENKMEIKINFGNDKNLEVFSTDIINTLLNATTNKEGMELLFDVKNDKLTEEENDFKEGINHILDKIDDYQNKIIMQDINSDNNSTRNKKDILILFNSIYKKGDLNNINNNIMLRNNIKNISINLSNKENISELSNNHNMLLKLMNNKNKIIKKDNKKYYNYNTNEIKKQFIKNRNKENKLKKYLSNKILNINVNDNTKNKSKIKNSNEKMFIDKIEKELFASRKKLKNNKNCISQNISTSIQSKKDFSLSKKNNISQLNLNTKNLKNQSLSTLIKINDIPSSKVRSTKLSSSNSFIKEIKNKQIHSNGVLQNKNITKSYKNLNMELNSKNKLSRNNQFQNPSKTTNIFNNIIKYINKKYIDSRNKANNIKININASSKINITNLTNKHKNNKINFNNTNNIYDYETQNNKEKKILYNKKRNNMERNFTLLEKSLIDKKSKSFKYIKKNKSSNMNSARNLFANSYKNINTKKLDKKTIDSYNYFDSTKNVERKKNNKNKLVINCTHIKLNLKNRTKNNSRDNSYKNSILTNLNLKSNDKIKKIYYIKKNNINNNIAL